MRTWPADVPLADREAVHTACRACAATFRVHENLGGHRMRCRDCGAWIDVPRPARPSRLELQVARIAGLPHPSLARARRAVGGRARPIAATSPAVQPAPAARVEPDPARALAPRAGEDAAGRRATARRSIVPALELALLAAAAALPFGVGAWILDADARAVLAPFAALVGALGVVLVGLSAGRGPALGLRRPARPLAHFVEGAAAAGALFAVVQLLSAALVAEGWPALSDPRAGDLARTIGPLGALGAFALAPALLGELAFRGVLQGRLRSLLGGAAGVVLAAAAFAALQGIGPMAPVHLALGLHLGWLRERSGSLLPGMLAHLLFGAAMLQMA